MKNMFYKLGAWLSVLPLLLLPSGAYAQLDTALTELGKVGDASGQAGSGAGSLPTFIGQAISAILGVLGIVFVVLIIYAGILYMTAAGETEKVDKAKTLMIQAVIGIVIIVAAYGISSFVIQTLVTATR